MIGNHRFIGTGLLYPAQRAGWVWRGLVPIAAAFAAGVPLTITTVRAMPTKDKLEKTRSKHEPKQGRDVTLLKCGALDPEYQRFVRGDRFIRRYSGKDCVKARQGQARINSG